MVAVKLNRIASGVYHEDSFDDARVYLAFVQTMQSDQSRFIAEHRNGSGPPAR